MKRRRVAILGGVGGIGGLGGVGKAVRKGVLDFCNTTVHSFAKAVRARDHARDRTGVKSALRLVLRTSI